MKNDSSTTAEEDEDDEEDGRLENKGRQILSVCVCV